jgi:preprotein translocase subunit SecB
MMAETSNDGQGGAPVPAPQAPAQPNLSVIAQYVKDLSFENPGAPGTLKARRTPPSIAVSVSVQANQAGAGEIEVELKVEARATEGETVLFVIELVYAGLFRLTNIPAQDVAPLTLIECPRLLFPFARQIISDASRNGGFPPLLIDPIDFVSMYRQRLAAQQQGAPPPVASTPPVGNA